MEFDGHKLKTKVYVLQCELDHDDDEGIRSKPGYTWANAAFKYFLKSISALGSEVVQNLKFKQVQQEVETNDFYGYSTLMFIFYFNCLCESVVWVNKIFWSLQINDQLSCITKIVLDYSFGLGCAHSYVAESFNRELMSPLYDKDDEQIPNQKIFRWRSYILSNGAYVSKSNERTEILKYSIVSSPQYFLPTIDNLVFISCKITGDYYGFELPELDDMYASYDDPEDDDGIVYVINYDGESDDDDEIIFTYDYEYDDIWKSKNTPHEEKNFFQLITQRLSEYANKKSIQEICKDLDNEIDRLDIKEMIFYVTTTYGGCYFFNINPALFIAINHLTFQNLDIRVGAEKDLEAIKKACRQQRIPHLIIEDATAEEALELLDFIQTTDLSILKHLFVCIMSHGDEGDIIYTKTSSYTADDVKQALLKNPSLRDVETLLFLNFCRGDFHPEYALIDETQPLELTDASDLDDTTVVLYSARKGCVSLREKDGSPCVQKFAEALQKCFRRLSVTKMHENMENYLLDIYYDFDSMTELVSKEGANHILNMEFHNTSDFMELYKLFENHLKIEY